MNRKVRFIAIFLILGISSCSKDADMSMPGGDAVGTGGSLARFTISGDYLYAVDSRKLLTFSIHSPMEPLRVDQFDLEWGVETIFAMDTIVFVGTQEGMHMFDISDGSRPGYLAGFEHVRSCDPVVAQDTLAFVTLRSGNACANGSNQLDVINIRDLRSPQLLASYPMENPHGLGVDGNILFVCEGNFGLKVFEIHEDGALDLIHFYHNIRSQDVIIKQNNLLIVVAEDGLFQYDYSDVRNIQLLSKIDVVF